MSAPTSCRSPMRRASRKHASAHVDELVRQYQSPLYPSSYFRIVTAVRHKTRLLKPSNQGGWTQHTHRLLRACGRLADYTRNWLEHPETWCPPQVSGTAAWRSLLSHLFEAYPTPSFVGNPWLQPWFTSLHAKLHIHLGAGRSTRKFELPGVRRFTKSEAKWFLLAPDDCLLSEACVWALTRSIGGSEELAKALMASLPENALEHWDNCWRDVAQFFIREVSVSLVETSEIINLVRDIRFASGKQAIGPWMSDLPIDPEFSIKRWSLRRVRRHMAHWREAYPRPSQYDHTTWARSNIGQGTWELGGERWTIEELCSASALRKEGHRMRHCVGTYVRDCLRGECTIWSLRRYRSGKMRRIATIDVDPVEKRLVTALGKANSELSSTSREFLDRWLAEQGIQG